LERLRVVREGRFGGERGVWFGEKGGLGYE